MFIQICKPKKPFRTSNNRNGTRDLRFVMLEGIWGNVSVCVHYCSRCCILVSARRMKCNMLFFSANLSSIYTGRSARCPTNIAFQRCKQGGPRVADWLPAVHNSIFSQTLVLFMLAVFHDHFSEWSYILPLNCIFAVRNGQSRTV